MVSSSHNAKTEVATYHFYAAEALPYRAQTRFAPRIRPQAAEFLKKVEEVGYGCSQEVPWRRSVKEKLTSEGQLSPFQQAVGAGWLHF